MASQKILLKRSIIKDKVPVLEPGELATNLTDRLLYIGDMSGDVIVINPVKTEEITDLTTLLD